MSEHDKRLVRTAIQEIYAKGDLELANELVDHWGSRDDLGLLGQLGLLPVGEEPEAG